MKSVSLSPHVAIDISEYHREVVSRKLWTASSADGNLQCAEALDGTHISLVVPAKNHTDKFNREVSTL